MIFDMIKNNKPNTISINEIASMFEIEEGSKVIIFESVFFNEQLLIKDIGNIVDVSNTNRYIAIDRFRRTHYARMKVSAYGIKIKDGNEKDFISIYYVGYGKDPEHVGDISNIDMSNDELIEYKNLFVRNLNLIYLNGNKCPKEILSKYGHAIEEYVESAFIHDELLRIFIKQNPGTIKDVKRDPFGNLILINKKNVPIITFSLDFEVVNYNENLIYGLYYHYIEFLNMNYKNTILMNKFTLFIENAGIYI